MSYKGCDHRSRKRTLQRMDPNKFEHHVAKVLKITQGWDWVGVTKSTRDMGLDIIAIEENVKIGIQVKRYAAGNKVGDRTIRECFGAKKQSNCHVFKIVCSSDFTEPAKKSASKLGMQLINGDEITQLSLDATKSSNDDSLSNKSNKSSFSGSYNSKNGLYTVGSMISVGKLIMFHRGEVVQSDQKEFCWKCDSHCPHGDVGFYHTLEHHEALDKLKNGELRLLMRL